MSRVGAVGGVSNNCEALDALDDMPIILRHASCFDLDRLQRGVITVSEVDNSTIQTDSQSPTSKSVSHPDGTSLLSSNPFYLTDLQRIKVGCIVASCDVAQRSLY